MTLKGVLEEAGPPSLEHDLKTADLIQILHFLYEKPKAHPQAQSQTELTARPGPCLLPPMALFLYGFPEEHDVLDKVI
jgi:hypothetical protein